MNRKEFLIRQQKYLEERERAHFPQMIQLNQQYEQKLLRLYARTQQAIAKELEHLYLTYAQKEGLSISQAKKAADKADILTVKERIEEKIDNKHYSKEAKDSLKLLNLRHQTSRLTLMKYAVELNTVQLAEEENQELEKHLRESALEELSYRSKGKEELEAKQKEMKRAACALIMADFQSAHFSQRVWVNQRELRAKLTVGLERSLLRGENPKKWARSLNGLLRQEMTDKGRKNAYYCSRRIAITETSRVRNSTAILTMKEQGYSYYIWICEPSACKMCKPNDGKIFKVEGARIGLDTPPLHPFCVCSIAEYMSKEELEAAMEEVDME